MQSKATKSPTKAERERMESIRDIGCVVSLLKGRTLPAEIHHIVTGNRRVRNGELGTEHRYTLALSPWHHRSIKVNGWSAEHCRTVLGPPLGGEHASKREFIKQFGTEWELLELQDRLYEADPNERYLEIIKYRSEHL